MSLNLFKLRVNKYGLNLKLIEMANICKTARLFESISICTVCMSESKKRDLLLCGWSSPEIPTFFMPPWLGRPCSVPPIFHIITAIKEISVLNSVMVIATMFQNSIIFLWERITTSSSSPYEF